MHAFSTRSEFSATLPEMSAVRGLSITSTERIEDVEAAWRTLEARGTDLPGQRFAFIRSWLDHFAAEQGDRVFLVVQQDDLPVMLLPLCRKRSMGVSTVTWMTGDHLGACAPLFDAVAFAQMREFDKHQIWSRMTQLPLDADVMALPNVPTETARAIGLRTAFASTAAADKVFRARFDSWEECDSIQRNKHRRKIDRQQTAKLEALGPTSFEILTSGDDADGIIDIMFAHKAARFREMGIADPFASPRVKTFYKDAFKRAGGVLHVLRVNGDVVAVRYSLSAAGGLFCLISSMTTCTATQAGSPGKQGLLRVMQTAFDSGFSFVDMGRGENDEKRQWCNEQIELAHYCRVLTPLGHLALAGQNIHEQLRTRIKGNPYWFELAKKLRKTVAGNKG